MIKMCQSQNSPVLAQRWKNDLRTCPDNENNSEAQLQQTGGQHESCNNNKRSKRKRKTVEKRRTDSRFCTNNGIFA